MPLTLEQCHGLALVFDKAGTRNTAARLHDKECNAARVGAQRRFVRTDGAANVCDEIEDLEQRGWKVTRCRCCK